MEKISSEKHNKNIIHGQHKNGIKSNFGIKLNEILTKMENFSSQKTWQFEYFIIFKDGKVILN